MPLDRTGEPIEDAESCPYSCQKGWLSAPDADIARPCPRHRPSRNHDHGPDYEPHYSDEAAAAIARADGEDRHV